MCALRPLRCELTRHVAVIDRFQRLLDGGVGRQHGKALRRRITEVIKVDECLGASTGRSEEQLKVGRDERNSVCA